MLPWFLDARRDFASELTHTYDPSLICASVIIACLAGYAALSAAGRIATTKKRTARFWWLMSGAFTMGVGVWTMHFIGMLAFRLPVPVTYDVQITLLSTVPAILASGFILWLISRSTINTSRLVIGGTLMGAGIGAMHYIGMAAMRMDAMMLFDPVLLGVSILVAVALAIIAAYAGSLVTSKGGTALFNWPKLGGALFMGCAVAGMHYTGMAAAHFFPGDGVPMTDSGAGLAPQYLGAWTSVASLFIAGLTIFMTLVDSRLEAADQAVHLLQEVAVSANQADTVDTALQTAIDQVCAFTGWPLGHAYLRDGDYANGLRPSELWHTSDDKRFIPFFRETEVLRMLPGVGLPGRVLVTGKPAWITDITKTHFPRAKIAKGLGLTSAFAFPVLVQKEVGAVLEFFSLSTKKPDPALLEVMAHVGAQIGRVLERRRAAETIEKYQQHLEEIVEDRTRELQRNKSQLEAIVKSSPNGILLIDDEGRIKMTNAALDRMFGYEASELLEHRVETLVPESMREKHVLFRGGFARSPRTRPMGQSADLNGRRKDGSTFPIDVALASFKAGDERFVEATVADITERKRAESALRDLNANLERKVEQRTLALAAASAAKSEFLANMSHEIRTPMNGMLGLAQLLEREPLSKEQLTMVSRLRQAGQSLLGILNDILDFSKIEAGQLRLDPQPFELAPMLAQIGSLLGATAHAKGLALHVGDPPPLAGGLIGDALRLEQVLMNLVGNAVKFTEKGEINLRVEARSITTSHVRLRFEVQDTGIGISPQQKASLFTPFTQADGAITRRFGGTGLGLSICKRLVEMMQGEIGIDSAPGVGSTFWFEAFFEHSAGRRATDKAPAAASLEPGMRLPGLRCLVVDDSRMNREVVQRMLTREGASAVLAGDGQQALQYLSAQNEPFDAVLMDVQMPVMDGLAATRTIRQELDLKDLPIIVLTAGVLTEQRRQAMDAGASDFLAKPIDLDELVAVLLRCAGSCLSSPNPG